MGNIKVVFTWTLVINDTSMAPHHTKFWNFLIDQIIITMELVRYQWTWNFILRCSCHLLVKLNWHSHKLELFRLLLCQHALLSFGTFPCVKFSLQGSQQATSRYENLSFNIPVIRWLNQNGVHLNLSHWCYLFDTTPRWVLKLFDRSNSCCYNGAS